MYSGRSPHNATQTFEKRVRKEVYEAQLWDDKDDLERGKKRGNLLRNTKVIRYEITKVSPHWQRRQIHERFEFVR